MIIPPQVAISSQASRVDPSPDTFTNPMFRWSVFRVQLYMSTALYGHLYQFLPLNHVGRFIITIGCQEETRVFTTLNMKEITVTKTTRCAEETEKKKNKVEHYTYEDYDDEDDYWKVTGDNQEQQDSQQYSNNQQHNDDKIAHQNHETDDLRSEENNNDIDRRHANSCGTWTRCAQQVLGPVVNLMFFASIVNKQIGGKG